MIIEKLDDLPQPCGSIFAKYCVKILDIKDFWERIKKLPPEKRKELRTFKRWFESNYYCSQLWRAIVKDWNQEKCLRHDIWPCDVDWIKDQLSEKDRVLLRSNGKRKKKKLKHISTRTFNLKTRIEILKELESYANWICRRKCRFLYQYDNSISHEDLVQTLMETGVTTFLRYEPIFDKLKVTNYAKRSIHNCAINIIRKNTVGKRATIINEGSSEREYKSVVTTVDPQLQNLTIKPDFTEGLLFDVIKDMGRNSDVWVNAILRNVPAFESHLAWLGEKTNVFKAAQEWSGVKRNFEKSVKHYLTNRIERP